MLTCASLKKIFLSYFHLQVKPKVSEGVSEPRFHLELGGFEPEIFFFSEAHGNIPILLLTGQTIPVVMRKSLLIITIQSD